MPSGEQRTFPNLLNREGVLNLEYLKWSDQCTPQHNVDVAYTRALAGPMDYHLGGFWSVSPARFQPRYVLPEVLGTRCHHLAMYVVYENPMPMISDAPLLLDPGEYEAELFVDGSLGTEKPNAIRLERHTVSAEMSLEVTMAPGRGFVAAIRPKPAG